MADRREERTLAAASSVKYSVSMNHVQDAMRNPRMGTYVAVAKGRPPLEHGRRSGSPDERLPSAGPSHAAGASHAPELAGADDAFSAERATSHAAAVSTRQTTAAIHLRLALPHVRAALRQLRDTCRAHVRASAEEDPAMADEAETTTVPTPQVSPSSAAVAAELSVLADALMEMDAEALRACCKCIVEHTRRLLGCTGKRSTERIQLATLLFSLSRFMPLVVSLDDKDKESAHAERSSAPSVPGESAESSSAGAAREDDKDSAGGGAGTVVAAAAEKAARERERATSLVDAAERVAAAASGSSPAVSTVLTLAPASEAVARVVAGLRSYAAAVGAWQAAVADDEFHVRTQHAHALANTAGAKHGAVTHVHRQASPSSYLRHFTAANVSTHIEAAFRRPHIPKQRNYSPPRTPHRLSDSTLDWGDDERDSDVDSVISRSRAVSVGSTISTAFRLPHQPCSAGTVEKAPEAEGSSALSDGKRGDTEGAELGTEDDEEDDFDDGRIGSPDREMLPPQKLRRSASAASPSLMAEAAAAAIQEEMKQQQRRQRRHQQLQKSAETQVPQPVSGPLTYAQTLGIQAPRPVPLATAGASVLSSPSARSPKESHHAAAAAKATVGSPPQLGKPHVRVTGSSQRPPTPPRRHQGSGSSDSTSGPGSPSGAPAQHPLSHSLAHGGLSASLRRPYRDALLPPQVRGADVPGGGSGNTMLAHILTKNATAAAIGSSTSPGTSPPMTTSRMMNPPHVGAGGGGALCSAVAPSLSAHHRDHHIQHRHHRRRHDGTRHRATRYSENSETSTLSTVSPRTSLASLGPGYILCRICEAPVSEEGLGVHSLCCKALRDTDMALGGSASAAERFRAALPVLADLAECGSRRTSSERDGGGGEVHAPTPSIASGVARWEDMMDEAEFETFGHVHQLVINTARGLAAAAVEGVSRGGMSFNHIGLTDPPVGAAGGAEAVMFSAAQDALEEAATTAWAHSHQVVETVSTYFLGILRDWLSGHDGSVGSHVPYGRADGRAGHGHVGQGHHGARRQSFGLGGAGWHDSGDGGSDKSSAQSPRALRDGQNSPSHGRQPGSGTGGVGIEDFEVIKLISSGAYGKVYLSRKHATGDMYAIKVIRKKDLIYKNMIGQAMAERDALINTDNPFIVKLFYTFASTRHLYIVTEYAVGGDLYSLLQQLGRLSEEHARQYTAEIVLALEYCHSHGIIHRDVKPDNLLISASGHIKLTDFGLSNIGIARDTRTRPHERSTSTRSVLSFANAPGSPERELLSSQLEAKNQHHAAPSVSAYNSFNSPSKPPGGGNSISGYGSDTTMTSEGVSSTPYEYPNQFQGSRGGGEAQGLAKGTPDYLAPEVLMCEPYGPAVDWWALGVVVFEMLVGVPPFHAPTPMEIFQKILSNDIMWPAEPSEDGPKPAQETSEFDDSDEDNDEGLSVESKDLISRLLTLEVDARLGSLHDAVEVKNHAFFTDVDWDLIYEEQSELEAHGSGGVPPLEAETSSGKASSLSAGGSPDRQPLRTPRNSQPMFIPQPDDEEDTSYFAPKPRRSPRTSTSRSDRTSSNVSLTAPCEQQPGPMSHLGPSALNHGGRRRRSSLSRTSLGHVSYASSAASIDDSEDDHHLGDPGHAVGLGRAGWSLGVRVTSGGDVCGSGLSGGSGSEGDLGSSRGHHPSRSPRESHSRDSTRSPHRLRSPSPGRPPGLGLGQPSHHAQAGSGTPPLGGVRPSPLKQSIRSSRFTSETGQSPPLSDASPSGGSRSPDQRGRARNVGRDDEEDDDGEWIVSSSGDEGGRAGREAHRTRKQPATYGAPPPTDGSREDDGGVTAQIPESDDGVSDDGSRSDGFSRSSSLSTSTTSSSPDMGDSGRNNEPRVSRRLQEAELLPDFAYTNLTELALSNMQRLSLSEGARRGGRGLGGGDGGADAEDVGR